MERWHWDTNTFHLLVGEMKITMDYVSSLLHLPIVDNILCHPLKFVTTLIILVKLLGVDQGDATSNMRQCWGPHIRLSWLWKVYEECCIQQTWEYVAREYLLHLLRFMIFADKSVTFISISYLQLFRNFWMCDGYSWGVVALTHMYGKLGDVWFA